MIRHDICRRLTKMVTVALLSIYVFAFMADAEESSGWPQFRYDGGRTAASPHALPDDLELRWTWTLPAPRPAFPHEIRLAFDKSYEPVALDGMLFVPSMVTDSVTALDAETGQERWRFFAEGPVRFAPVAWNGKVYFVSDDGHLYCLDAGDGSLLWKFRGLPEDQPERRVIGDGRLVSLCPARGGPVLVDGVIYFGAGLWPTEGIFVHAVDAETGEAVWSNTESHRIPRSNWDHGIGFDSGLTPQGYFAIIGDKLVIPNGAQLPALLDAQTGDLHEYTMGWGGRVGHPKGAWFVAGVGNLLCQAGDLYDLGRPYEERVEDPDYGRWLYTGGLTRLEADPGNQRTLFDFRQPVFTHDAMYESGREGILARDITAHRLVKRDESEIPLYRRSDVHPDTFVGEFDRLWDLPATSHVHIKAGDRLYAGAAGVVEAIAVGGDEPEILWRKEIKGTPNRMLAADGRLFVVTVEGMIYAFAGAEENSGNVRHLAAPVPTVPPRDEWTQRAAAILEATGVREGYALVLGIDEGRLVEELARQSDLHIIALESNADKAAALRTHLHRAGLYGKQAAVVVGDPVTYPFPPYMASLIVSETPDSLQGADDEGLARAVFHALRPYGGVACVWGPLAVQADLEAAFRGEAFPGADVREAGGYVLVARSGSLPGAADWSHAGANAANTGASEDEFLRAPMAMLWFNGQRRWHKFPGQQKVRVAGGRLVVLEEGELRASDVYTGRKLWEVGVPIGLEPRDEPLARQVVRESRRPIWGPSESLSRATQMVVLDDAIYVSDGTVCMVFDAATGELSGAIELPEGLKAQWTNLRVSGDFLVGTSGRHLLCVNRHTGELLWDMEFARSRLSLAVGNGNVFCAEVANLRRGEDETRDGSMRALDLATGDLVWEREGGAEMRYSSRLDILVTPAGVYNASDGSPLLERSADQQNMRFIVEGRDRPETGVPGFIAGDKLLTGNDDTLRAYVLPSAEPLHESPLNWVRRGCTGTRASVHLVTTRYRSNSAWIDLDTLEITPFLAVRPACSVNNNLYPANGVLNMPNLTAGCTCNFSPVSLAAVPVGVIRYDNGQ